MGLFIAGLGEKLEVAAGEYLDKVKAIMAEYPEAEGNGLFSDAMQPFSNVGVRRDYDPQELVNAHCHSLGLMLAQQDRPAVYYQDVGRRILRYMDEVVEDMKPKAPTQ